MGWSYAEVVGWLEEMSTLSSVNQRSQPKSGGLCNTMQSQAKAKAGPGKKQPHSPSKNPGRLTSYYYSYFVTETISNNSRELRWIYCIYQSVCISFVMSEKLCLKWNDFQENVNTAFGRLRDNKEFSDVTLACEDGQQFEVHKVVLASSSPTLHCLLKANKHPHPLHYGEVGDICV